MNHIQALRFVDALGYSGMKFDLSRMKKVMGFLHHPENSFPSVHIAGTNGKGSVAAYMESALASNGLNVGLYTSPHLIHLNERFRINQKKISNKKLTSLISSLSKFKKVGLTQFEFLTVMAFVWFAQKKVDIAIIETGLGGRLDATNILTRKLLTIITNVDYDHMTWLGRSLKKIAQEKAGIIKPHVPLITGAKGESLSIIQRRARKVKAPLIRPGSPKITPETIGMIGSHQLANAHLAWRGLTYLSQKWKPLNAHKVKRAFKCAFWPGRFQPISFGSNGTQKTIIVDGAHNVPAMKALVRTLKIQRLRNISVIFGVLVDKDIKGMVRLLQPITKKAMVIPVSSSRSTSANKVAAMKEWNNKAVAHAGFKSALKDANQPGVSTILVTGSLYLAGEALSYLSKGGLVTRVNLNYH